MRLLVASLFLVVPAAALGACVSTSVGVGDDAGVTPNDATTGSDACAGFDLQTDPKHCGSCTNVCTSGLVCSAGKCKASCDAPLIKCAGDSGACVDTTKDPLNCGSCGSPCSVPDGGPEGGTGNPDAGVPPPDGGYGPGWYVGTGKCASSKCGIDCPPSTTLCTDNLCWDTQWSHDHCGDCTTACAAGTEHCNKGKCCGIGLSNCNNTCVNLQSDKTNCGGCGITCSGGTPNCIAGVCKSGPPPVTFTAAFPGTPSAICTQFQTFMSQLGSGYSQVTLSGSADPVGVTCNIPAQVDALAAAMKNISSYTTISCNGHVWSNCARTGPTHDELWIDPPAQCSGSNCPSPGRILRPCFGFAGYSALQGATCGATAQTITLTFQ